MSAVDYEGIGKRYGAVKVMEDVSFAIGERRFVVLLGPSGCGKTTLLRMTAGLEKVSEGEIRFEGRRINELHPRDRDIAMVFQSYALYPQMKVYDNIAFGLQVRKEPKADIERKVREAAEILDLGPLLDRYPRALSGGQRQRVAMGRALVRHPKVFLFDEPLSNLDAKLRAQMRLEIRRIHDRLDTTTIYVTHDQIEAMTMADDIVVMREGNVEQMGSPDEVYDRPANCFVADFVGSPSINFVDGTVERGGETARGANGTPGGSGGPSGSGGPDRSASDDGVGGVVRIDGQPIPLPVASAADDGQKVRVGIRPLDIDVLFDADARVAGTANAGSAAGGLLRGTVEFVENTGAESHVHAKVGEAIVRAVSPERLHLARGAPLALRLPASKLHLFDAASERRID